MATFPFWLVLETTLTAGGTGTVSYPLPSGETLKLTGLRHTSTGLFNITDIRNSNGVHYTNASISVELPGQVFPKMTAYENGFDAFPTDLVLEGGSILYIELEDASAAGNTVTLVLQGIKETP